MSAPYQDPQEQRIFELVSAYRDRSSSLTSEELDCLSPDCNFHKPCQVELFWMDSPVDSQLMAITHDENRSDLEININGPYGGSDFIQEVDEVLEEPRWIQLEEQIHFLVDREGKLVQRRELMTPIVRRFVETVQQSIFREDEEIFGGGRTLSPGDWCSILHGDIANVDIGAFIDRRFNRAQSRASERELGGETEDSKDTTTSSEKEESELTGFGAYIYEPVWIGGEPQQSFEEEVFDRELLTNEVVIEATFQDRVFFIYQDGKLFIEGEDSEEILPIFNTIFATSMFFGRRWHALQSIDLIDATTDPNGESWSSTGAHTQPRALLETPGEHWIISRDEVSVEDIVNIIEKAEEVFEEEDLRSKVIFALQAFTHFLNGEYSQAFLLNWILIEQHLSHILENHLESELELNHDRRNRITDSPHWFASHKIELVEIIGAIDESTYKQVDSLRSKRNNIVHSMETASAEESQDILNLALTLLSEELPGDLRKATEPPWMM